MKKLYIFKDNSNIFNYKKWWQGRKIGQMVSLKWTQIISITNKHIFKLLWNNLTQKREVNVPSRWKSLTRRRQSRSICPEWRMCVDISVFDRRCLTLVVKAQCLRSFYTMWLPIVCGGWSWWCPWMWLLHSSRAERRCLLHPVLLLSSEVRSALMMLLGPELPEVSLSDSVDLWQTDHRYHQPTFTTRLIKRNTHKWCVLLGTYGRWVGRCLWPWWPHQKHKLGPLEPTERSLHRRVEGRLDRRPPGRAAWAWRRSSALRASALNRAQYF